MRFADPWLLTLLLALPWLHRALARRDRPERLGFPVAEGLAGLPAGGAARARRALPWLRTLCLVLLVLALARPQWGLETTRLRREGIAIAMVIDVSSSMSALDLVRGGRQVSRLEVVKAAFRDFVAGDGRLAGRAADQIGMIRFARFADVLAPPTLDHAALLAVLERLRIVDFPLEDGTAIGDAIVRGVEMLRATASPGKVLILLTDGSSNVGRATPVAAAQIAAALGIKIYAIGAGTTGTAAIPLRSTDGRVEYRLSAVTIDEETLEQVAAITGGRAFRATDAASLAAIYGEIDRLERSRDLLDPLQVHVELFPLLAGLAFLLLASELGLGLTRLLTVP